VTETERIARGLIDRRLPKSEWTHHAHPRLFSIVARHSWVEPDWRPI
jgi:hypothetical protein